VASAPLKAKKTLEPKKAVNPLFEKRPKNFGIGKLWANFDKFDFYAFNDVSQLLPANYILTVNIDAFSNYNANCQENGKNE